MKILALALIAIYVLCFIGTIYFAKCVSLAESDVYSRLKNLQILSILMMMLSTLGIFIPIVLIVAFWSVSKLLSIGLAIIFIIINIRGFIKGKKKESISEAPNISNEEKVEQH